MEWFPHPCLLANWRGKILTRNNSCREKFCWEKFCPNLYFSKEKISPVQLGVEKYVDQRKAPEIFEGILTEKNMEPLWR